MSQVFFKIGATDFSGAVDVQSYAVNNNEVYESWTDANWIEHRNVVRHRIEGRLTLGYRKATDFATAVSTIATAVSANGYAACTLLALNDGTTHAADCFLDIVGDARWDETNSRQWQTLEINVRER